MSATAPPKLPRGTTLRAARAFDVGTVLDGKFRVDSVLGQGGMAVVVAATHLTLGHAVAIKLLLPEALSSPAVAERVLREARAAAGLTSETVTRVLDIDALDSGEPYIVMERLVGMDFGRLLEERGTLSVADVATYLVQACEAVAEAHAKGIIHRDLKPNNLFLTTREDGRPLVKLMDFGISKLIEEDPAESLTRTHESLGTPHYMSPEQLLTSRGLDTRTDVWALGVILFRLLTGEYPFDGETVPAVHIAVAADDPPKLRSRRPDAPAAIEELVAACLVKSREERLPSVQAFAAALLPFADADTRKRFAYLAAWDGRRRRMLRRVGRGATFAALVALLVVGSVFGSKALARRNAAAAASASTSNAAGAASLAIGPDQPASADPADPSALPASSPGAALSSSPAVRSAGLAPFTTPTIRRRPTRPATAAPEPSRAPDPYGQRR